MKLLQTQRRTGQAFDREDFSPQVSFSYTEQDTKPDRRSEYSSTSDGLRTQQLLVVCDTTEQFDLCVKNDYIETLAIQLQSIPQEQMINTTMDLAQRCVNTGKKLLLALPGVFRKDTADFYEKQWNCILKLQNSPVDC